MRTSNSIGLMGERWTEQRNALGVLPQMSTIRTSHYIVAEATPTVTIQYSRQHSRKWHSGQCPCCPNYASVGVVGACWFAASGAGLGKSAFDGAIAGVSTAADLDFTQIADSFGEVFSTDLEHGNVWVALVELDERRKL